MIISDKSLVVLLNLAQGAGETQAYKEIIAEMGSRCTDEIIRKAKAQGISLKDIWMAEGK